MPGGVCAFDIDNTITCGKDRARELISWCRDRGFELAFITARPAPVPPRDWRELGFSREDVDERLYFNPRSFGQTGRQHGRHKVGAMEDLRRKNRIRDKKCVLLLDDMPYNVNEALDSGFSAIRVGERGGRCGLSEEDVCEAQRLLSSCVD